MNITSAGTYKLPRPFKGSGGARSSVFISGASGGATLKFVHINSEGDSTDLVSGSISVGTQYILEHGSSQEGITIAIEVTGGSGTDIVVDVGSLT